MSNYVPSTFNYQLSTINYQLSTPFRQLRYFISKIITPYKTVVTNKPFPVSSLRAFTYMVKKKAFIINDTLSPAVNIPCPG